MNETAPNVDLAFDAYPRPVVDHVVSEFDIRPGELVVDAGCQLTHGLSTTGALVFAIDTFALPAAAVASLTRGGDAPVHFARGRPADLPEIIARELGAALQPRVVAFGSSFRFVDRPAALDACDRCGAEGVALVFGTSAPSPWRTIVADVIVDFAHAGVGARAGAKNESLTTVFVGSRFSHVAKWQTEMQLKRTADEVAALAAFYAMRAGIVAEFTDAAKMMKSITVKLGDKFPQGPFVEDVTYTVISARRAYENQLSAHTTARGP